jgi:hypothetical protein
VLLRYILYNDAMWPFLWRLSYYFLTLSFPVEVVERRIQRHDAVTLPAGCKKLSLLVEVHSLVHSFVHSSARDSLGINIYTARRRKKQSQLHINITPAQCIVRVELQCSRTIFILGAREKRTETELGKVGTWRCQSSMAVAFLFCSFSVALRFSCKNSALSAFYFGYK